MFHRNKNRKGNKEYKLIKENKSEQALQIISHVVAESNANKRSLQWRRQFVVSNMHGNLPALLPNATPLVRRFFGEMSNKRQF
jgi:hypothetical protein